MDDGEKICANSIGDIYIAGNGSRDYLAQDTSFDYINTGGGSDGGYISRFSPTGILIANGDYGGDPRLTYGDIFCDAYDNVFAYGSTNTTPPLFSLLQQTGWYWDNYTQYKCFLAEVSPSNTLLWSTLYGSIQGATKTSAGGMCIDGSKMYICGLTTSSDAGGLDFPLVDNNVSSFQDIYGGNGTIGGDAFVARFDLLDANPTSILNISNRNTTIKCYPNPSNGQFIVSFSDFGNGDKTITLYDYMGQSVYKTNTNQTSVMVSKNGLSTGMYIVQVASSAKQETTKIVISQ